MADIYNINGVPYCASASTVNGVTQTHTYNVDDVIKDCATEDCFTCGPFKLSINSENCTAACGAECTSFWSVQIKPPCTGCNLVVGQALYSDQNCTPAANGYYSGQPCGNEEYCQYCYQVNGGVIVAITLCNSSDCATINTSQYNNAYKGCGEINQPEEVYGALGVCSDTTCTVKYTDGTPGSLVPGDHLWISSGCNCDPSTAIGFYRAYAGQCVNDKDSQCVDLDVDCRIRAVQPCREVGPDLPS